MSAGPIPFIRKNNMAIFDFLRRKPAPTETVKEERSLFGGMGLGYNTISSYTNSKAMRLSTAYACTNILSNAVAMLPIKVKRVVDGKLVLLIDGNIVETFLQTPH